MPYGLSSKNKKKWRVRHFRGCFGEGPAVGDQKQLAKAQYKPVGPDPGACPGTAFCGPSPKSIVESACAHRHFHARHRTVPYGRNHGSQNGAISGQSTQMESAVSPDTRVRASRAILSSGGARMHVEIRGASGTQYRWTPIKGCRWWKWLAWHT